MAWIARLGLAAAAGLLLSLPLPTPARAQFLGFCSATEQCPADRTCQPDIPLTKRCKPQPCNEDRECPMGRHACEAGVCTAGCRAEAHCGVGEVCSTGNTGVLGKCQAVQPAASVEGRLCGTVEQPRGIVRKYGRCPSGFSCRDSRCRRAEP